MMLHIEFPYLEGQPSKVLICFLFLVKKVVDSYTQHLVNVGLPL